MMPTVIPPAARDGEFTVIYPPTELDFFIEKLKDATDIAIASLYLKFQHPSTQNTQVELRVLRGWGKPHGELLKLVRGDTGCGEFESLEEGLWYVVLYSTYGYPSLMQYELVKEYLVNFGPASYTYTPIGILPK